MSFEIVTQQMIVQNGSLEGSETFVVVLTNGLELICKSGSPHHIILDPESWTDEIKDAASRIPRPFGDDIAEEVVAIVYGSLVTGNPFQVQLRCGLFNGPQASIEFVSLIAGFKVS